MHSGPGVQSGHYYAIIRLGRSTWIQFDDSRVSEVDKATLDGLIHCSPEEESGGAACPYILVFSVINN